MHGVIDFLFRREVALTVFVLLKLAAVIAAGLSVGTVETWGIGILALVIYTVIAWFASQRLTLSIWAATILMLYEGSNALLTGFGQFRDAPAIGVIGTVMGVYLFLGALAVFTSRHRRQ